MTAPVKVRVSEEEYLATMTDEKQYEVRCGMCARELYVDEESHRLYSEALLSGLDNPFRCEVCSEEYDDLVYEG